MTAAMPISTRRLMRVTGCGRARKASVSGATLPFPGVAGLDRHGCVSRHTASVRMMRTTRCGAVPRRSSAAANRRSTM